jgi:hypothetical protein
MTDFRQLQDAAGGARVCADAAAGGAARGPARDDDVAQRPQQRLYFWPEPHGHGSLRPG